MKILRKFSHWRWFKAFLGDYRWYRKLHGGQWWYQWVEPCRCCIWFDVDDDVTPETYREPGTFGTLTVENWP